MHVRQALYHLCHALSPSCFSYFLNRVLCLCLCLGQPGPQSSYLYFQCHWLTGIGHCTQLLVQIGSQELIPDLPQATILLISTSQVTEITSVSYHTQV
jgi:hypothetical protein